MRGCALFILSLLSLSVLAQSEPRTFVPRSPLNPAELAQLKERLKRGTPLTDADVESMVKDENHYHAYRESDIVAAFPELRGDKKLSACSNSMMSGATEIVFMADARQNEVTIKTIQCTRVDKGLSCGAVRRDKYYFLESPEHFFSLKNLTLGKARIIVEAYEARRITDLPDWFEAARPKVRSIEALSDGRYRMHFGEYFCSGCRSAFNVRLETSGTEPRLVYVGDADAACI
jgi:hypothetical protein